MNTLSNDVAERARKIHQKILQRISTKKAKNIASDANVSEATFSRFKNEDLEHFSLYLASLGFKLVETSDRTMSQEDWIYYQKVAFKALAMNLNIDVNID